jgi:hypothetical protein
MQTAGLALPESRASRRGVGTLDACDAALDRELDVDAESCAPQCRARAHSPRRASEVHHARRMLASGCP